MAIEGVLKRFRDNFFKLGICNWASGIPVLWTYPMMGQDERKGSSRIGHVDGLFYAAWYYC